MSTPHRYRFQEFTYDAVTGELANRVETVRLQPQPAAALRILLENAGQLVSRERLKQSIWPDTVVEADQGLNFCVRQIRLALGEDAEGVQFIETLPRRGYRFAAAVSLEGSAVETTLESEVKSHDHSHASSVADDATNSGNDAQLAARSFRTRRWTAMAALLAVTALVTFTYLKGSNIPAGPTVAVLPLRTANTTQWISDQNTALTEALVSTLTNAPQHLGIIGPATTNRFATATQPHTEIGKQLNADFVISGGLRISDSTMFVQMIRVTDGIHVFAWRQPLNNRSADSLAVLVANGIAMKLK